jgi:DNA repair exonuclease SbcCD ATPase subunit
VIPLRIRLKGFLSYKDQQDVTFDGASLWMLSGLNGSGKSSVFDAVTYALFGHHRGGGQHAHELINKDCDSLLVEFDFTLDGQLYRAKRTLRRDAKGGARGTQQMLRYQGGSNGDGHGNWAPIEGTGQKREFDGWVAENIGLTYETFTSSVLLLQGKAEKLLDSKPEGRREVLASIVDLERYERLHRLADEKRKTQEASLKLLTQRLAALPGVTPEEVAAAAARIAEAEASRAAARAEVERLQGVEYQARGWVESQARLGEARQRWQQAQGLLGDAPAIEQAVGRLRELRDVLPRMHEIHTLRNQAHQAKAKAEELTKQRQEAAAELDRREHALRQAREKRGSLQSLIAADEARQRDVSTRLRQLTAQLEKLKEYERQEADRDRVREELARLPADPAAAAAQARAAHENLLALAQAVPLLARFRDRRDELREAVGRDQAAQRAQVEVRSRGERLAAEVEQLRPRVQEAARALEEANERATEARTRLQQARESLRELTNLGGARVCRHCGQSLTEGHVKDEKRRRSGEVAGCEAAAREAVDAQAAGRSAEAALREQFAQAERKYQEARLEYRDAAAQMKQARQDVERLQAECGQAYAELPARFRVRACAAPPADWLATAYPSADELAAVRAEANGLPAARQALQEAERVQQQWGRLQAQEAAALQILQRLQAELPADRPKVRQEHARLQSEDAALERGLAAQRAELQEAERDFDRLTRDREQAQAQRNDVDTQLAEQALIRRHAEQTLARAQKALPPAWREEAEQVGLRRLSEWEGEKAALEADGTDERGRKLQEARLNVDVLQRDVAALEAQQDAFPAEARQDPAAVRARLAEARQADRHCDEELGHARQQRAQLEGYRRQRAELEQEATAAEGELAADKLLAELLGRERLQLYLVRQAERQVVEHANAVLDRLSGGKLYLRLSGEADGEGSAAKALELEAYNRATGERPINVAFLSGSQKFRVAVSLALGIGQYASRQHRPIEAVIIDEGFGCLDHQGRQVMIQELQNLRSQMRCILLVSHQEEFAEAFADGYHFQLEDGATRVRRVQK